MGTQRRIETDKAKALRNARQHFAVPGGSHDKLVKFLGMILPMGVGVLAALMVITPLSPRGEVSFLLDRNKVAVIDERLRVDNALYRGKDNEGRPFSLTAGEAVQKSGAEGVVRMNDLVARLLLPEGPARVGADAGTYTIRQEQVNVPGEIRVTAADGYQMTARGVSLYLETKRLIGEGRVEGTVPAGTFSADRLEVDLSERIVALDGNAKLRMVPGKLRIP